MASPPTMLFSNPKTEKFSSMQLLADWPPYAVWYVLSVTHGCLPPNALHLCGSAATRHKYGAKKCVTLCPLHCPPNPRTRICLDLRDARFFSSLMWVHHFIASCHMPASSPLRFLFHTHKHTHFHVSPSVRCVHSSFHCRRVCFNLQLIGEKKWTCWWNCYCGTWNRFI